MGQYYKAIILNKDNTVKHWFDPYSFDNGSKLMEHSYIGNNYCNAVENFLRNNPQKLVWAGDYADNELDMDTNLYFIASGVKRNMVTTGNQKKLPKKLFVINHSKQEYYSRDSIKPYYDDWVINPLPLLTCEGNGRGGGDYHLTGDIYTDDLVGSWSRDEIEISDKVPDGYCQIYPNFFE